MARHMAECPFWTDKLQRTLQRYSGDLVRTVAARLIRPRNEWPVEDLIDRCVAAVANPALIDRRLKELDPACRRLLAMIAHSRQPRWRLGSLLELLAALGNAEGPRPVFDLFTSGLLYPDLPESWPTLNTFEQWLGQASATAFTLFVHPLVAARCLGEDLGLPELSRMEDGGSKIEKTPISILEADGLEWPLRLAVLWQQVKTASLRLTQQGDFFKRDLERLRGDVLLNGSAADRLATLPDSGLLAIELARVAGLVKESDGELKAADIPSAWEKGLPLALTDLWAALPRVESWDIQTGWRGVEATGNPFPAAYLLAILVLARLPEEGWTTPEIVGRWVLEHHPFWGREEVRPSQLRDWADTFFLGLAYPMRWVQLCRHDEGWLVRLSPTGRAILAGEEPPSLEPGYSQTLLVQPNLEIIVYRQGMTMALIAKLARFATWRNLGAACTLQLEPESVYRALESGETFESIVQTLEQHGTRATPLPVIESLRTWANKRERISVYPAAALLEFHSAEDLNEALARGLPGVRVSDRLALVPQESQIDYRHFRLLGTRDYSLPPERCVEVEPDGVTLTVDTARSDLLLETELPRFAEVAGKPSANGRRQYRLTPASVAAARTTGLILPVLETWFQQRTGQPVTPAARLLLVADQMPAPELQHQLVLHVANTDLADGLMQWPATQALIQARLGPTALVIARGKRRETARPAATAWPALRGIKLSLTRRATSGFNNPHSLPGNPRSRRGP